ncbi:MAG: alpha/beta hydrolase [Schlesneria sp.]|nr:alpha/beta hydrolase [Schlesneria sp.]
MSRTIIVGLLAVLLMKEAAAQPPIAPPVSWRQAIEDELAMKTMGGRQFWGDVQFFQGWRIQQNVFTRHYRLLDADDHRHASGTLEDCQRILADIRKRDNLPPMTGRVVILIHGILRSSKCMTSMASAATAAGYQPILFDYPSTQVSIPTAAEFLHSTIESLEGIEEIHIVSHSMGGLVTRAYFAEHTDPRIKRIVMVGTPNHGAELADLLHQNYLVRAASGPGGRQLVTNRQGLIPSLPTPPCDFAVIAGARGNTAGWNPFIPGDDDGTVTVASTRLAGAVDFSTVKATHTLMLGNQDVIQQTIHFLREGQLVPNRPREPITVTPPEPTDAIAP